MKNAYSIRTAALLATLSLLAAVSRADIPIWVELEKPQLVTVVIENEEGVRVRNLVAEMQLPAGRNRLSWDGYGDGTRSANGDWVRQRVAPGSYRARGLVHDGLTLTYEFTVYSGGNPPWPTPDYTGGWLADHSCPLGAVFIPASSGSPFGNGASQVLLTSLVAECGSPLVLVDTHGNTLWRRHLWGWSGAIAAARDASSKALPGIYAYLVVANDKRIIVRGLKSDGGGAELFSFAPRKPGPREPRHNGHSLAVHDGLAVVNSVTDETVVFIDLNAKKVIGELPLPSVRALAFDAGGRLLLASEGKVLRFRVSLPSTGVDGKAGTLALEDRTELIATGLENPRTLAFDPAGKELYVADWGKSHQVKVFTPEGKPLRSIGTANDGAQLGLYDELKMQAPLGLAIDDQGQLWVVEASHLPKRVSLWDAKTGDYLRSHYGPPGYGGGGTIDPTDKTRLFYKDYYGLIEFALDWTTGTAKPKAICVNGSAGGKSIVEQYGIEYGTAKNGEPSRWGFVNERPVTVGGRTYLVGFWRGHLRGNGPGVTWLLGEDHIARPVSRVGSASFNWPPELNAAFRANGRKAGSHDSVLTAWTDRDGNRKVDVDEWDLRDLPGTWTDAEGKERKVGGLVQEIVHDDLSVTTSWGLRVPPPSIDAKGLPIYDLAKAEYLLPHDPLFHYDEQRHWGQPVLPIADGWVVAGFAGWRDRRKLWTYPNAGDGPATRPGELVQPTRLLGPPAKAAEGEAGHWLAWNGEKGNMYLLTSDGLFLQTLGGDMRTTPLLRLPKAERGTVVDRPGAHVSFEDEHFHPTLTTTHEGEVYLVAGKEHSSIFRVDGFASVKRREFGTLALDAAALAGLPEQEVTPAAQQGRKSLLVECGGSEPVVDGTLDEYAAWAAIGRGREAAVRIGAKQLYAAWRTGEKDPLANGGGDFRYLFKRGGGVDLMLRTDMSGSHWDPAPRVGDLRLLVTRVNGKVAATLYRSVVPGHAESERVQFTSPIGETWFDEVADVSVQVTLAQSGGDVEISVPLDLLGLTPDPVQAVRADLGILRGDGAQVIQRLYWNNLDTLLVSDIPSEARLQPENWGEWRMVPTVSRSPRAAVAVPNAVPGLACRYFEGTWALVPDFATLTPKEVGVAPVVSTAPAKRRENYALEFSGFLRVPAEGLWSLALASDNGSRLWLGDVELVNNDGPHGMAPVSGLAALAAGLHPIRVGYFQGGGGAGLELRWSGPGVAEQAIPAEAWFHMPEAFGEAVPRQLPTLP